MLSIYRKYRPKIFAEMVGQSHIKLTLQNEIENDQVAHAYLFCGPRGLGKTTAARLMAKAVNCKNRKKGESEPCNVCRSCSEINKGKALDLIEIDAASHTGVDNVRENIIENVRVAPHKSKYKIFIIDEVHMLSISAFNALLKTLEEPPSQVIFILCTTEIHKVPETIISRCQRFDFKKVAAAEAIKRLKKIAELENIKIEQEVFEIIAAKSDGCMRDAESLLGQLLSLGTKNINKDQAALVLPISDTALIIEMLNLLTTNQLSACLEMINRLVEDGVDLEIFSKGLVEFLRKLLLIKLGVLKAEWFGLNSQLREQAEKMVENVNLNKITAMIRVFLQVCRELKENNTIIQLPMELAAVSLCQGPNQPAEGNLRIKPSDSKINQATGQKASMSDSAKPAFKLPSTNNSSHSRKANSKVDLSKIKKNWPKIISQSHKKSRDLLFVNEKMVYPIGINGSNLEIGFKYDLHKCRFESNSNQQIFNQVIKQISGQEVLVKARTLKPSELVELEAAVQQDNLAEQVENPKVKATGEDILGHILESFGGQVVDE